MSHFGQFYATTLFIVNSSVDLFRFMTIVRALTSTQPDGMLVNKAQDLHSALMPMPLSLFALPTPSQKVC
jgi:hypothetical protein